jgi:hypothetical protein
MGEVLLAMGLRVVIKFGQVGSSLLFTQLFCSFGLLTLYQPHRLFGLFKFVRRYRFIGPFMFVRRYGVFELFTLFQ